MADTLESLEIQVKHSASGADSELKRVSDAVRELKRSLSGLPNGLKAVGKSADKAKKPLSNFVNSLKRIAFYRMIRSIIKGITQALSEGLTNAYLFSKGMEDAMGHRFAAALDEMKSASSKMKSEVGAAFLGLYAAIAPVLTRIINLLTVAMNYINQFFAALTGTTYIRAKDVTEEFAENTAAGAAAAKEWKNQLLGFDEINRLDAPNAGGGGAGGLTPGDRYESIPLDDWAMKIHDNLAAIEAAAGTFLLALGLILTLTGSNIPLGLGLIAGGAITLKKALSEDWGLVDAKVSRSLAYILNVAGRTFAALGVIMLFTGHIGLGIGLIAAGITQIYAGKSIGETAKVDWSSTGNKLEQEIERVKKIVEAGLIVVGMILLLAVPTKRVLGLGLILGGLTMAIPFAQIKWGELADDLTEHINEIMGIVIGAFLVIGTVLLFAVPGKRALGIGLILAGLATGAGMVAMNWESLYKTLEEKAGEILELMAIIEMIFGAVLLFAVPGQRVLGIGLLLGGIATEGLAIAMDWGALGKDLEQHVKDIIDGVAKLFLVIGIVLLFAVPGHRALGLGLVIAGLAGEAAVNEDWDSLFGIFNNKIADIMSLKDIMTVIGFALLLSGATAPLGLGILFAVFGLQYESYNFDDDLSKKSSGVARLILSAFGPVAELLGDILGLIDTILAKVGVYDTLDEFYNNPIWEGGRTGNEGDDGIDWSTIYATGGHPQVGELFIAREAGPEMVGTIGGQNTVATNADIVEGIKLGVFEAVSAAMNGNTSSTEVKVYLDSREIRAGQQRLARSMGV